VLPEILIIAVLCLIFVQDLLARSVYWFLFPVLLLLLLAEDLFKKHRSFEDIVQTGLINCAFLLLQFLLLSLYFTLKNKRWVNMTAELLGWGDILLLLCVAFYLPVLSFLFFYMVSLVTSLLAWVIWQVAMSGKDKHIPLAGLQAAFLSILLIMDWYWLHLNLTDDAWILNFIHK
jgi:hypothetical protein